MILVPTATTTQRVTTKNSIPAIELRGGRNESEGNIFVNGRPICDDEWDIVDATVACKMLG